MTQSSYLMAFIRSLMENSSMDIREKKRRQLEKDFTETGAVLNICLTEKFGDVNKILNTYGIVSQRVRDNKTSVAKIQRDLIECKSLLYCNREELRRLWLELVEQRRCLELVDQLDRLRSTPDALGYLVTARAWSEATSLMINSNYMLESEIASIPAVQTLKTDLAHKNKFLIDELRKELNRLLYDKPFILALDMHLRNSSRDKSVRSHSDLQNVNSLNKAAVTHFVSLPLSDWYNASVSEPVVDVNLYKEPRTVATVIARSTVTASHHEDDTVDPQQHQQHNGALSHSDWIREIVAVTHCLMRLQKLPQYLGDWRPQSYISQIAGTGHVFTAPLILGQGLIGEIHRSIVLKLSKTIENRAIAQNDTVPLSEINSPRYLIKLLELVFDALFMQARACLLVLRTLNGAKQKHIRFSTELQGLTTQYIWSCVQYEVYCILLTHLNNISPSELNELSLSSNKNGLLKLQARTIRDTTISGGDITPGGDNASASLNLTKVDLNTLMGRKRIGAFNFASITTSSNNSNSTTASSTSTTTTTTTNTINANSTISTPGNTTNTRDSHSVISTISGNVSSNHIGNIGSGNFTNTTAVTNQGQSNVPLFSFSNSSHYLGISSYLSESRAMSGLPGVETQSGQNLTEKSAPIYPLACRPSGDNILSVYKMVMEFIEAVEWEMIKYTECSDLHSVSSTHSNTDHDYRQQCQLRTLLKSFIENIYLPGKLSSLRNKLQKSINSPDVLTSVVSQQTERELNLNRPVLLIVYVVDQCLNEVRKMCTALPEFASGCLHIGLTILEDFTTAIWRLYKNIGELETGLALPSSEWSKDDDVSRFWKKFPSWQRMATHEARLLANNTIMEKSLAKKKTHETTYNHDDKPMNANSFDNIQIKRLEEKENNDKLNSRDKINESDTIIKPVCAIALGLYNSDTIGCNNINIPSIIPFTNGLNNTSDNIDDAERGLEYMRLHGIIHEREATRLAVAETDQLIHMIRHELPECEKKSDQILPTLRNIQLIKALGRLTESLCWLCYRVLNLDTWTQGSKKYQIKSSTVSISANRSESVVGGIRTPSDYYYNSFVSYAKELNRFSEACLLMTYLEVRIQAYNYFGTLPDGVTYWCPLDDVDVDKYVTDFLGYIEQVKDLSIHTFSRHKFRFIFDGLGDFISQLLLRLIPQIERMNSNGNKKMCRNVYRLQQALATLTETHESDLIRVKQLYELFFLTPEAVVNRLMEHGIAFDHAVYANLFHLYQRSHSTYAYSKIQSCISRLATVTHSGQL
ncbi:unnamed protein product [Schistosoma rodhaini]|uniref:Exocyst complex component Sec8 n=3 Tax=Schistosoma rodhaini TaxID=6188 RepID=A0AA85G1B0_9TREM|nr:unnamed protein product [Schistosoma rodhaini]CAH8601474.1 unnamed protein product [Schistosoma rodhaini]